MYVHMSIYVLVILGESRNLGVSGISGWSAPFTFRALRQWMKHESTPPNGWNFEGELTQTCKFFAKLSMEYDGKLGEKLFQVGNSNEQTLHRLYLNLHLD